MTLSSTIAWMESSNRDMDRIVAAQVHLLRGQMTTNPTPGPIPNTKHSPVAEWFRAIK